MFGCPTNAWLNPHLRRRAVRNARSRCDWCEEHDDTANCPNFLRSNALHVVSLTRSHHDRDVSYHHAASNRDCHGSRLARARSLVLTANADHQLTVSRAPERPRNRMRSKRWWVFRCAKRISTFLRSRRSNERLCPDKWACEVLAGQREELVSPSSWLHAIILYQRMMWTNGVSDVVSSDAPWCDIRRLSFLGFERVRFRRPCWSQLPGG